MTTPIRWTDLVAETAEGERVDLTADVLAGRRIVWRGDEPTEVEGLFIAAPGEEPSHDTPRVAVDWAGCRVAVEG